MSIERMPHPAALLPAAVDGLTAVRRAVADAGLPGDLLALTRLRVSQINGCGPGVAGGVRQAAALGVSPERLAAVAAWRETPWFTGAERAALALTEAVTRLADQPDPVPDDVWDLAAKHFDQRELAALLLAAAIANLDDRLDRPTRRQVS
ncbi:carboxymuconolactone decarboxylase family protein [Actinoplanes missouriensis]|uniref:carboxymuconolactone decarboxylase family protein n=1 Tax=Actinoplanes missouriensis TaxID=1866 RepID=UPI003400F821